MEIKTDGRDNSVEENFFSACRGKITSVTTLQQDRRWQISVKEKKRNKQRNFTFYMQAENPKEEINKLNGAEVVVLPDKIKIIG